VDRAALWRPDNGVLPQEAPSIFDEIFSLEEDTEPLQAVQSCDLQTYLPFDILAKVDVASMMNSLEVRTPLVDRVVVDYATSIPPKFNMAFTPDTGFQGKLLLKKILGRSFPKEFLNRPKQGFGVPIQPWFGPKGTRSNEVRDRLTDPGSPLGAYFDPAAVSDVATGTKISHQWLLLFLDQWLRNLRENPGLALNR
jgi:asparagine synthase (glutamine-hydrolysing)